MSRLPFLALAFLPALGAPLFANDVTHVVSTGPIPVGGSATASAPVFDPSLGALRVVRVTVLGRVSGTWGVENTAATTCDFGGYASGHHVGASLPVTLPAGGMQAPTPAFLPDAVSLAAFDGTLDYAGPSGHTYTFADETGDGGPSQYADVFTDAGLQAYVGTGSITIGIGPVGQTGPYAPPGIQSSVSISADALIHVRYTYDPFPAHICRAQSWSGCPCANVPSNLNAGCANSAGTFGGVIDASGTSSIAADTLVLQGSSMTSSSALYFQGTSYAHAQAVYGDGLVCVGGTIVRLGTKVNASGSSQFPETGDPPISVGGGVAQPGPRSYQVVYRDAGSFCTPSSFNATSGMVILWTS
jgi:hypothetical protein